MADERQDPSVARRPGRTRARLRVTLPVLVVSAITATALALTLTGGASSAELATTGLYAEGVGVLPDGTRVLVPTGVSPSYLPGSRVLDPAATAAQAAQPAGSDPTSPATPTANAATSPATAAQLQAAADLAAEDRAWLAAGTIPGADGPYADMVADALLDLHALLMDDGAVVAAWSAHWRYVWPRDAAFTAVAFARTGHVEDALAILGFLDSVQAVNGDFEARYLPDGSGPPDGRSEQTDGTGWALWAAGETVAAIDDPADRAEALAALRGLVERSTSRLVVLVARDGLPPVSSDYWEVRETRLTLGTAAPVLAGLQAGARLLDEAGSTELARQASAAADASAAAIETSFGPGGYGRYADRTDADADAASAFVLPPFLEVALPGAEDAWRASAASMARPAGGIAPGAAWRQDGVSWTPETALYGLVAASTGDGERASTWLTWIDEHRTLAGAIPEKVLADGSPAAVAPLAWSAACVVLAVDALDAP